MHIIASVLAHRHASMAGSNLLKLRINWENVLLEGRDSWGNSSAPGVHQCAPKKNPWGQSLGNPSVPRNPVREPIWHWVPRRCTPRFPCGHRHFGAQWRAGATGDRYGSKMRLPELSTWRWEARTIPFQDFWRTEGRFPQFQTKLQIIGRNNFVMANDWGAITSGHRLFGGPSCDTSQCIRKVHESTAFRRRQCTGAPTNNASRLDMFDSMKCKDRIPQKTIHVALLILVHIAPLSARFFACAVALLRGETMRD